MRVPIPHQLGKDEARARLKARSGDLAGMMPGGMADVAVTWPDEDRMNLAVKAMGSSVTAAVEIGENADGDCRFADGAQILRADDPQRGRKERAKAAEVSGTRT